MGVIEKSLEEMNAYEMDVIEDLTINDALILVAVCASKEDVVREDDEMVDAKRISALAQDHPLFFHLSDSIKPTLNKFMNMIKTEDTVKYVAAAAKVLKPKYKKTAFTWAAKILMPDGVLTETRKNILDKYSILLNVDMKTAQRILVEIS